MRRLFLLFTLLSSTAFAATEFKLLTWNTFLIPPPWNMTKQIERANLMAGILPKLDHDVIFFQETFYDRARRKLVRALAPTHPYVLIPKPGRRLYHIQDSGLFVASRYHAELKDQIIFTQCTKADCLSSKSAMLVEITFPGQQKVQFINTHMQAWDEPKTRSIRRKQLTAIKAMMKKHSSEGVPQILVGDLNIDGNLSGEFQEALEFMNMSSDPLVGPIQTSNGFSTKGCFKKPGEGSSEWLDHFWLNELSTAEIHSRKVLPLMGKLLGQECPLSDHYAVEANLVL